MVIHSQADTIRKKKLRKYWTGKSDIGNLPHHRFHHYFQNHLPFLEEYAHGHVAQFVLLAGHPESIYVYKNYRQKLLNNLLIFDKPRPGAYYELQ